MLAQKTLDPPELSGKPPLISPSHCGLQLPSLSPNGTHSSLLLSPHHRDDQLLLSLQDPALTDPPPRRRCWPSPLSLLPLCPADAPLSPSLSLRITNRWKLEAFSYAPLFVLVRLCLAQRRLVNAVVRSWLAVTPSVRSRSCPAMRGSLLPRRPGLLPEAQPTATVQKVQAPLATPGSGRRPPFDRLSMFPSSFSSS